MRPRILLALASLALASGAAYAAEPRGAFVVTLGRDTTSVERYTRERDRLVVEMVGRSPRVLRRTYFHDFAQGALSHFEMVVVPPGSEVPTQVVKARPDGDSLRTETQTGTAPVVRAAYGFPQGTLLVAGTSPWAGYEGEVHRLVASKKDTLGGRVLYLGARDTERFLLRRQGRDSVVITNTRLDRFHARIDKEGNILGTRASGGTYQVALQRVAWPDLDAISVAFQAREQAGSGLGTLSPRDTVRADVGGAKLSIDYGRPAKRGRVLFGSLVPYGEVWRTGANAATQLRTDRALDFGGTVVPAGSYTLWTVPHPDGWKLLFNSETGQWGTAHKGERDVFTVNMKVEALAQEVERFTITIESEPAGGVLRMDWDTTRASARFLASPN
jgi:hypothetical protein